jgi:hypothetical protein
MASKNNITGDRLINKTLTKEGEENWDKIFGKKKLRVDDAHNLLIEEDINDTDAKRLTDAFPGL